MINFFSQGRVMVNIIQAISSVHLRMRQGKNSSNWPNWGTFVIDMGISRVLSF